jgi:hypothetical protein
MTLTRTTFFSSGAVTAIGLMLLAQNVNPVPRCVASTEAPAAAPVVAAMPDPAATAVEDLASWPIAATR